MCIEEKMQVKSESQNKNQCFTCLGHSEECMQISSDAVDSDSVSVVDVLIKHFWFQRDEFTSAQHVICENCWNRLDDFHRFYQQVEENHRDLNVQPSETCQRVDASNVVVQTHSEIEIKIEDVRIDSEPEIAEEGIRNPTEIEGKEQDSCHPSEVVESEDKDSSASSSDEEQIEQLNDPWPSKRKAKPKWKRRTDADEIITAHRQYNCTICQKHFQTFHHLKAHIVEVHKSRAGVICCGKGYFRKLGLLDHVLKLEDPDRFKCDICGKVLAHTQALRTHKKEMHVEGGIQKYHCDKCPRRFHRARALKFHMKEHTNFGKESIKCPYCPIGFSTMFQVDRHIKIRHESGNFVCNACEKVFATERYLQQHMLQHKLSPEEQRVQCNICDKWLKNKNSLNMHFLIHTAPKECEICGRVLEHQRALLNHRRRQHITDK